MAWHIGLVAGYNGAAADIKAQQPDSAGRGAQSSPVLLIAPRILCKHSSAGLEYWCKLEDWRIPGFTAWSRNGG